MGVMSDREIRDQMSRGLIRIEPFDKQDIQPASVDLHLDVKAKFRSPTAGIIEVGSEDGWQDIDLLDEFTVVPGDLVIARTLEKVRIPPDAAGETNGLSSLGRIGLLAFVGCSWMDPGYEGQITLEIMALHAPVKIQAGMRIVQLIFHDLTSLAIRPYGHPELGSRYQGGNELLSRNEPRPVELFQNLTGYGFLGLVPEPEAHPEEEELMEELQKGDILEEAKAPQEAPYSPRSPGIGEAPPLG